MNPKVSIIIPAYNTEKFIAKAIKSALEQTEQNIEVIVVDDASSDSTVEVIRSFTDRRLRLFINESNRGPSYARNCALREARGEWIGLLDSDDWYTQERLEKLLCVACEKNADIIADDMYCIEDEKQSPWGRNFSEQNIKFNKPKVINSVYLIDFNLSITKPLIKRSFLLKHNLEFNEALRYEEDLVLFLMCLLNGAHFIIVPEAYYFYRNRKGSLTTEHKDFYDQAYRTNLDFLQQPYIKNNPALVRSFSKRLFRISQTIAFYRVRQFFKQGDFLTALIEALKNPSFFIALCKRLPGIMKYYLSFGFIAKV